MTLSLLRCHTNGFGYSTAQLHGPTGTIVITAPTGPTIQYSVGGPYQSSTSFTGLMPNNYRSHTFKLPQQVVSLCR
ncbi:MAG: hypothetical protein R2822_15130 [Spirosomataceae bacterium]